MEIFSEIVAGFAVALTPANLLYCLIGVLLGMLVGILPGISPVVAIAMLLPITFQLEPVTSLIMLAGIYYGASSAGSITAIMLNMPGEPSAVVLTFDGHPLAKQGKAGYALCVSALSGFAAGTIAVCLIAFLSPALAKLALSFQAPEYTVAIILALLSVTAVSADPILKSIGMTLIGVLIGTVGIDITSGVSRFTFGDMRLAEGLSFVAIPIGLFAFTEIALTLGSKQTTERPKTRFRDMFPPLSLLRKAVFPALRGAAVGVPLGILPGGGPLIASITAYALERRIAKDKSRFGKGAIEGVAAPEAAANSAAFNSFIPMLSLGIPASVSMALMLGGLLIQGVQPGPKMVTQHPDVFWGLISSMWVGNLMLLALCLPLVGVWIKLLQTPYKFLYPLILACCCIGIYTFRLESFDILVAVGICIFGYAMNKFDCPPAPLLLGVVLGPMFEENLRRTFLLSRGDPTIFVTRPISLTIVLIMVAIVTLSIISAVRRRKQLALSKVESSLEEA
jgi:putative tricarboxylic transport membrane protein